MWRLIIAVMILLMPVRNAVAESNAEALKNFGLLGSWSPDCAKDPIKDREARIKFAMALLGSATMTILFVPTALTPVEEFDWEIREAKRVTEDKIRLVSACTKGRELSPPNRNVVCSNYPKETTVIERMGKKIRIVSTGVAYEKCLD